MIDTHADLRAPTDCPPPRRLKCKRPRKRCGAFQRVVSSVALFGGFGFSAVATVIRLALVRFGLGLAAGRAAGFWGAFGRVDQIGVTLTRFALSTFVALRIFSGLVAGAATFGRL